VRKRHQSGVFLLQSFPTLLNAAKRPSLCSISLPGDTTGLSLLFKWYFVLSDEPSVTCPTPSTAFIVFTRNRSRHVNYLQITVYSSAVPVYAVQWPSGYSRTLRKEGKMPVDFLPMAVPPIPGLMYPIRRISLGSIGTLSPALPHLHPAPRLLRPLNFLYFLMLVTVFAHGTLELRKKGNFRSAGESSACEWSIGRYVLCRGIFLSVFYDKTS
jgi:hypothetical protein